MNISVESNGNLTKEPQIKRRKDCFFGIHSDFHAIPKEGLVIGATLKESDIREICECLKPDFIQIDCKGHPGWASYPTKMSNAMPSFKADPLMLWRKVTKEYGIGLYCHFSGVYDEKYCREHPEDAVLNADGNYESAVLPFSKYYDEYFIPQISELAENYNIDGVWIDGDCWSVKLDYRPETLSEFELQTGIDLGGKAPKKFGDPYYYEYSEFTRERFRKSLRHYTDILHKKHPELQICSNWAFSDHMPEKVCANVDFLSGDLSPINAVNSARYAGRMIAQQNMPWDLMSWNFRYHVYDSLLIPPKHPVQIMQEAASVIALGGAFQDNISQFPDATHNLEQIKNLVPLAKFMREREPYCFQGKQIHQAAMLVSSYDRYHELHMPFDRKGKSKFIGLTGLFCDAGQSLELVGEYTLKDHYHQYPLIIVPELYYGLDEETVGDLKQYALNGGSLLIIGTKTSRLFAEKGFGFEVEKYSEQMEIPNWASRSIGHDLGPEVLNRSCYFSLGGHDFGVTTDACKVTAGSKNAKVYGELHHSLRSEGVPFAVSFGFGKGKIAVISIDLGIQYFIGRQYQHCRLIQQITSDLYSPLAKIESACGKLELVCLEKNGRLMIQLINANGGHSDAGCISEDSIPPVVDISLSIQADAPPEKLLLQPENKRIDFEYKNGRIYCSIDRVNIHNIIEVI